MASPEEASRRRDFRQILTHALAGGGVPQQARSFGGQARAGHLTLHQFRHHRAFRHQIDHGVKRYVYQKFAQHPTERRHPIKRDHGGPQQRRLNGDRPAGGQSQIRMTDGIPGFTFDHLDGRAPDPFPKKLRSRRH